MSDIKFNRIWSMPNRETFKMKPVGEFVNKYLSQSKISVDPFARNFRGATYTNDINPDTKAEYHMEANEFLDLMFARGVRADLILLDWPYSPRQVKECYNAIGRSMTQKDGWTAHSRKLWKERIMKIIAPKSTVLTFGWNTNGMGKKLGFEIEEILMVAHGADHSDTICMAERKL